MGKDSIKDTRQVRKEYVALILIWFGVFAVGDCLSTFWLILNDPQGIANEANPAAANLYLQYGFGGLLMAKIGVSMAIGLAFLLLETRYSRIKWICEASEAMILGLLGYSLIILYNNFLNILTIQAFLAPKMLEGMYVTEAGMLILAIALEYLFLVACKVKGYLTYIEATLGAVIFLGPLIAYRPFFRWYLKERPIFYFAYLASVLTILATVFYLTDEIIKARGARFSVGGITDNMIGKRRA